MAKTKKRHCTECGQVIDPERIEALEHTRLCIVCARNNPEPIKFDAEDVCAKASPSGQNGWSPTS